jgi:hypothetical protein
MIDSSIPLQARPPQVPDIAEQYGRMLQLKNMMQQGQMGDAQLQQQQMQTQQMAQDQKDQQIIREAYGAVSGDLDKLHAAVAGKVSPKAAQAIKTAAYEQHQKLLTLNKDEFDLESKKLERVGNVVNGLLQMDDQSMASAWPQIRSQVIQAGDTDAQTVPEQFPGRQGIQMYANMIDGGKAAFTRADEARKVSEEARTAAKSTAELPGIQADTAKKVAEQQSLQQYLAANPGKTAADYEIDIAKRKAPTNEWDLLKSASQGNAEARKVLTEKTLQTAREAAAKQNAETAASGGAPAYTGSAVGASTQYNDAALKGLSSADAGVVKAMIEGRMPLPTAYALSKPYWQKMLGYAANYEPGFDATQWRVRLDTRVDFAKGKAAQNVRSLNTLVDHLGKLTDAIKSLDNSRFPIWNAVTNWSASQTGDPRITRFNTAAQAVESEAVNVFKGTGATDQEIKEMRENFKTNGAPAQQMEAARTVMSLAFGRLRALESQYEQAFRKARDFKFLNDSARKVLKDKLGINPDEVDAPGAMNQQQGQAQPNQAKPKSDPLGLF